MFKFTSMLVIWVGMMRMGGCGMQSAYRVPGAPADFRALGITPDEVEAQTDVSIARRLDRKPTARFPTTIAVARVQGARYSSHTARGYGEGQFTIVTTRDVEPDNAFDRLENLPMVAGVHSLNQLVMPRHLRSEEDLRGAAANVQADMLLIYTFDTQFETNKKIQPLGLITLGLFPDRDVRVTCTASAALMDTRNGFVYDLAEATAQEQKLSNAWNNDDAIDTSRRKTEEQAFVTLVGEIEKKWQRVASRYGPSLAHDG